MNPGIFVFFGAIVIWWAIEHAINNHREKSSHDRE